MIMKAKHKNEFNETHVQLFKCLITSHNGTNKGICRFDMVPINTHAIEEKIKTGPSDRDSLFLDQGTFTYEFCFKYAYDISGLYSRL